MYCFCFEIDDWLVIKFEFVLCYGGFKMLFYFDLLGRFVKEIFFEDVYFGVFIFFDVVYCSICVFDQGVCILVIVWEQVDIDIGSDDV